MVKLYDSITATQNLLSWKKDALYSFHRMMMDKRRKFPCIPAYQGYVLNHLRFGFVSDPRNSKAVVELVGLMKEYGRTSEEYGDYTALIIIFETPENLKAFSTHEFEEIFWQLLNQLSALDDSEWPEEISSAPSHHSWEYCFNKERYFFYCATPAHKKRKSRYFPYFMLAITPRWVLDKFNRSSIQSQKMENQIRKMLTVYDELSPHPDLKKYGEKDNYEWKQYFLRDDNTTITTCPFHTKKINKS
ncbi:YqcI/YcgG family protein [Heyndrickxia sp. FSL W8-0423]|uniref:YqcI/YcgG family protein n=1 Tax=Heyndrickxia sp. FSL W8-0423 TaxID=2921601 RepID=UPI0030F6C34E